MKDTIIDSDLHFFKGMIYRNLGKNDNRLQVRILPHMAYIKGKELDNLPKFPSFYKDERVSGKDEFTVGKDEADYVWVVATSDFQYGFVMGLASSSSRNSTEKNRENMSYEVVRKYLAQRRIIPEDFDFEHLTVQALSQGEDYGYVEAYNFLTGEKLIFNAQGTIFSMQKDCIYMRVGLASTTSKVPSSIIKMDKNEIYFKSNSFHIDANAVTVGNRNTHLVGTHSEVATSIEGFNLIPLDYTKA